MFTVAHLNPNLPISDSPKNQTFETPDFRQSKKANRLKSERLSSDFGCQASLDRFRYKKKFKRSS